MLGCCVCFDMNAEEGNKEAEKKWFEEAEQDFCQAGALSVTPGQVRGHRAVCSLQPLMMSESVSSG